MDYQNGLGNSMAGCSIGASFQLLGFLCKAKKFSTKQQVVWYLVIQTLNIGSTTSYKPYSIKYM